jgi:hypothetical protein
MNWSQESVELVAGFLKPYVANEDGNINGASLEIFKQNRRNAAQAALSVIAELSHPRPQSN